MNKRNALIISLSVLLLATVGGLFAVSYAYWSRLVAERSNTVVIGEGTEVTVTAVAEPPAGKVLVPDGETLADDEVDEVELVYNVRLSKRASQPLELAVSAGNVQIGGSADNAELVNISITHGGAVNDENVQVTVKVTLSPPETEQQYTEIVNKAITFGLTFSAAAPQEQG